MNFSGIRFHFVFTVSDSHRLGVIFPHFHACDSSQNLFLYTAADPTGTLHRSVGSPFCVQAAKPPAMSVSPVNPCRMKKF